MKKLIVLASLLAILSASAQTVNGPAADKRVHRNGGIVTNRAPGSAIALIDLRKDKSDVGLDRLAAQMQEACRVPFAVLRQDPANALQSAKAALAKTKDYGVALVLYSDANPDTPTLSAFPEDRIALVNDAKLTQDATPEAAASRIRIELWRAACFAAGGVNTTVPHCVLTNLVLGPADLDTLPSRMANPQACDQIFRSAEKLGLGRVITAPYRVACIQGWAPAPANDAQKAIDAEVKAAKAKAPKK